MRKLLVSCCVTALSLSVTTEPVAQPAVGLRHDEPAPVPATVRATNARFAGVWKLVDEESRDAAGKELPLPYAASGGRFGYITYDPLGYMGVVLAWVAQPTVSRPEPTVDEAAAALQRVQLLLGVVRRRRGRERRHAPNVRRSHAVVRRHEPGAPLYDRG